MTTILETTAWKTQPLGSLCTVVAGATPSRRNPDYFGGGVPWVKIGDMLNDPVLKTEETISELGVASSRAK